MVADGIEWKVSKGMEPLSGNILWMQRKVLGLTEELLYERKYFSGDSPFYQFMTLFLQKDLGEMVNLTNVQLSNCDDREVKNQRIFQSLHIVILTGKVRFW